MCLPVKIVQQKFVDPIKQFVLQWRALSQFKFVCFFDPSKEYLDNIGLIIQIQILEVE